MEKDVVCGMMVDPKTAAGKSGFKGQKYFFCWKGCKASFDKAPEKYAGAQHSEHAGHHR